MADPHWTSYVGMISGIGGAILAIVSLRKTSSLKSLDLRMVLSEMRNEVEFNISQVNNLITEANGSRVGMSSAISGFGSSAMVNWKTELEGDQKTIDMLTSEFSNTSDNLDMLNQKKLEKQISKVHKIQLKIIELKNKYIESIDKENESQKEMEIQERKELMSRIYEKP